jgi:hypothetical protein
MTRPAAGTAPASNAPPDAKPAASADQPDTPKLNLLLLSGIVVGSMIGEGRIVLVVQKRTKGVQAHFTEPAQTPPGGAAWLGVELDPAANEAGGPRISAASSRLPVWVIPTDEELMIARHTRAVIGAAT